MDFRLRTLDDKLVPEKNDLIVCSANGGESFRSGVFSALLITKNEKKVQVEKKVIKPPHLKDRCSKDLWIAYPSADIKRTAFLHLLGADDTIKWGDLAVCFANPPSPITLPPVPLSGQSPSILPAIPEEVSPPSQAGEPEDSSGMACEYYYFRLQGAEQKDFLQGIDKFKEWIGISGASVENPIGTSGDLFVEYSCEDKKYQAKRGITTRMNRRRRFHFH